MQTHLMFMCVHHRCIACVCKHNLISTKIWGGVLTASVYSCAEVKSAPLVAWPVLAEFGGRCRKVVLEVWTSICDVIVGPFACVCVRVCVCVCVCVLDREGSRMVSSRALVVLSIDSHVPDWLQWLTDLFFINHFCHFISIMYVTPV